MITKLPEKLLELRKYYGYSQQEIADKMGINVVEYMGWENGRAICNLAQFRRLATIFNVPVEDLLHNSAEIKLSSPLDDSIQIPFMNTETESIFFANKKIEEEVREKVVEEPKRKEEKIPDKTKKKVQFTKRQIQIVAGIVAALVILLLSAVILWPKGTESNGLNLNLAQTERLAAGNDFTVLIDDNLNVQQMGSGMNLANFEDIVAVSARSTFVIGLKSDGTVVGAGENAQSQLNVSDWKGIVSIAAGEEHTVGVQDNGQVVCAGSNRNQECEVASWENIKFVAAGDGFTIGVTNDGEVKVAGTIQNAGLIQRKTQIVDVAIGKKEILFLKEDKTVESVSYTGGAASDTSRWSGIVQVAAGSDFVAGLGEDGKVQVITKDNKMVAQVDTWMNVKVLTASKDDLVGYDGFKLMGAGRNSAGQYPQGSDVVTLDRVKNVVISQEEKELKITWDRVSEADGYLITINTNPQYSEETTSTEVVIPKSKFVEGTTYKISIVSIDKENEIYNSEAFEVDYKHTLNPTPVPTYTLTIKYVDADGKKVADDYVEELEVGVEYRVASPIIVGLTASITYVEGTMGSVSIVEYVRYTKTATPTPTLTPTPSPTTDTTACYASGGRWDEPTKQCVCPDGVTPAEDKLSCEV